MEFDNRIVERRYRARPIRCSATMNHHHLRKFNRNSTMLTPSNMSSTNPYIEPAHKSAFDHTQRHGQGVAGRVEEILNHSSKLLSSPRTEKYKFSYQKSHSVKIYPEEFDSKRVPEDDLELINEGPSRSEHLYHHTNSPMTSTISPSKLQKQYRTGGDHHEISCQPNQPSNLTRSSLCPMVSSKQHRRYTITSDLPLKILTIFVMNAILNQLSNHLIYLHTTDDKLQYQLHLTRLFPTVVSALTTTPEINTECRRDSDCDDMRCYQGKCICPKERPLEDRGICLPLSVVGEICTVSEQCLGNSVCIDSYCSCGSDTVSLFNPSTKIYYCHPKRRLREECSHDAQCPANSFCSTNKCLCQNGYGPVTVKNTDGAEIAECLPKRCSFSKDCESEYHVCEDNRCICLADHFDPHTAECYKFGSTGGKLSGNQTIDDNATGSSHDSSQPDNVKGFGSILKDLMKNSDKLWYVIIILAVLTIILLALIVMSLRKYFLGYCWTAHKKGYEPNNKSAPKSAYFNKGSINNKSFRQKNGETDDDGDDDNDDTAVDRSNLVTTVNKSRGGALLNNDNRRPAGAASSNSHKELGTGNRYVKVDMRAESAIDDEDQQQSYEQADSTNVHYQPHHQQLLSQPLSTSSSTAV